MKTKLEVVLFAALLLVAGACGPGKKDSKDAENENEASFVKTDAKEKEKENAKEDAEWVATVADAGMMEVKAAELAQTKSQSSDVKSFAAMMIKDHTAANNELKTLANQKGITVPGDLTKNSQDSYDDLAKKTGKDFDEAYTKMMVKDHEKNVDAFKKEADKGNDREIKSWAAGKLSTLEHHLQMAKENKDKVDKKKK